MCVILLVLFQPHRRDGTLISLPQVPRSSTGFPCTNTSPALCDSPAASLGYGTCSQSTGANKQSSAEISTKVQPSVPLSNVFATSFSHQHPGDHKREAKDSKWARFLPSTRVEENKDDGDSGEHAQHADVDHSALAQSPVMPVTTVPLKNTGCMSSGGSDRALLDKVFGVEMTTIFEKLGHSVNGNVCKQPNSPTITSRPVGFQKPVCVQPPPIKRPCPGLSISTLFHTDEDFDDTY